MFNNERIKRLEKSILFEKEENLGVLFGVPTSVSHTIPLKDQVKFLTERLEMLEKFLKVEYVETKEEFKGYKEKQSDLFYAVNPRHFWESDIGKGILDNVGKKEVKKRGPYKKRKVTKKKGWSLETRKKQSERMKLLWANRKK